MKQPSKVYLADNPVCLYSLGAGPVALVRFPKGTVSIRG